MNVARTRLNQNVWIHMVHTTVHVASANDTVFSNLTRGNGAPLCLMAQAVLSSRGQRALSIEKT
ncbi:hypothetical protein EUTSA_v10015787mg, partial [Eutrema salsugineum]